MDETIHVLPYDNTHRLGDGEGYAVWNNAPSGADLQKKVPTPNHLSEYITNQLTYLQINYKPQHTGYYPEEPSTFHLSKTWHDTHILEWDCVDFRTMKEARDWVKEIKRQIDQHEEQRCLRTPDLFIGRTDAEIKLVSKEMGEYANLDAVAEFLALAAEYHSTPKSEFAQGENDE